MLFDNWEDIKMPINSSHAYGKGRLYSYKKYLLGLRIPEIIITLLEMLYTQAAWRTFRKNSIMGNSCFLGPNSYCINFGKRENIMISDNFYCRGLLRCGTGGKGRIVIGEGVYIGDGTIISSENYIEIGKLTMISHGVHIMDSIGHPTDPLLRERDWLIRMGNLKEPRPEVSTKPIIIGKRVWIGFNSIIMRGVHINDNGIVAAGSVVVNDVEKSTIVAGNPAKMVKIL